MMVNADDLAMIITAEMGKPLAEAKVKLFMVLVLLNFAEEAKEFMVKQFLVIKLIRKY